MRALLAAAALAAVLPAAPSSAAATDLPSCVVALPNAAAGASASCTSYVQGLGSNTFGAYRTIYLVTATGTARLTLSCPSAPYLHGFSYTSSAPDAFTAGGWGAGYCTVTLTALTDGTSATATLVGSYAGTL